MRDASRNENQSSEANVRFVYVFYHMKNLRCWNEYFINIYEDGETRIPELDQNKQQGENIGSCIIYQAFDLTEGHKETY